MTLTHHPARPHSPPKPHTIDLAAVHQACQPIAAWWTTYRDHPQHPDPEALRRANARAQLLGPIPGPLGDALAYIVSGAPDLDIDRIQAAFEQITTAAHQTHLQPHDLDHRSTQPPTQLSLPGLPTPNQPDPPAPRKRR
jgi:hypothetical protein